MIVFETARLIIRHYAETDLENFYLLNSNEEVMRYIRPVKNRVETDVFLRQILEDTKFHPRIGRWAVDEKNGDTTIGTFAIIPVDNTDKMQLGYAFLKKYWGKGYATELTKAGLNYVFTKTGLKEIYALAQIPNIASQQVLLKSGFVRMENYIQEENELTMWTFKV